MTQMYIRDVYVAVCIYFNSYMHIRAQLSVKPYTMCPTLTLLYRIESLLSLDCDFRTLQEGLEYFRRFVHLCLAQERPRDRGVPARGRK